jgi:hypothetical protein
MQRGSHPEDSQFNANLKRERNPRLRARSIARHRRVAKMRGTGRTGDIARANCIAARQNRLLSQ